MKFNRKRKTENFGANMKPLLTENTTTNIADFGARERGFLIKLLQAWLDQGLPSGFEEDGVEPMMNTSSGNVFLTNSEYQAAMLNGDKLELFLSTPYEGIEGFLSDIMAENDPSDMNQEDVDFIVQSAEGYDGEIPENWQSVIDGGNGDNADDIEDSYQPGRKPVQESKQILKEENTRNWADFRSREIGEAIDLLTAWNNSGLPECFEEDEVTIEFNPNSGYVFLVNSEYQVAMASEGQLYVFHNLPYGGAEGSLADIMQENDPSDLEQDDIDYVKQQIENCEPDVEVPENWKSVIDAGADGEEDIQDGVQPKLREGYSETELVDYKIPVTKIFFQYLKDRNLDQLITKLNDVQERAIEDKGPGEIWFKFGQDDTLATGIREIQNDLQHETGVNYKHAIENFNQVCKLGGELFVYFDAHSQDEDDMEQDEVYQPSVTEAQIKEAEALRSVLTESWNRLNSVGHRKITESESNVAYKEPMHEVKMKSFINEADASGKIWFIKSYMVDVYEDSYEEGEGGHVNSWDEKVGKEFATKAEMLKYINDNILYSDHKPEDFEYDEESGLETSMIVDNDNSPASQSQIEKWKTGSLELYSARFSFDIAAYTKAPIDFRTDESITKTYNPVKPNEFSKASLLENYQRLLDPSKRK